MSRYIDRAELFNRLSDVKTLAAAMAVIQDMPAVDIVQRKDCRFLTYSDMYGECGKALLGVVTPNDYCSHGERKKGAE